MHQSDGILEQLARVVKGNRLETCKSIPAILGDGSSNLRNCSRCRTISYPAARNNTQQTQSNYTVDLYAARRTRRVLIERWKMTLKQEPALDAAAPPSSNSIQLRQSVFYQALKSSLHFSTITAILKTEFRVSIQSSERSGDFLDPNSQFQFSPNVQKLPVAPLDGGTELLVSIESLPRTTVPDILSILSASADLPHFASTSDCFGISPIGHHKHPPPATPEPIRPKLASVSSQSSIESGRHISFRATHKSTTNELSATLPKTAKSSTAAASKRLSGLLDDSGYAHSPNFSALDDGIYSPPSKIIRREISSTTGTIRNLLTSPPIERQLKYEPEGSSRSRKSFKFPTIRRNVSRSLLVNFEESILQERLRCVGNLEGFSIDIGAMGSFCPTHLKKNLSVRHFATDEDSLVALPSPYLGTVKLSRGPKPKSGYQIPKSGYIQMTLLNPEGSVVRLFSIPYDFNDMPPHSRTFLRHRTVHKETNKLRYLIQLKALSSLKGTRFYLHGEVKIVFSNSYKTQALGDEEFQSLVTYPSPKYSTITNPPSVPSAVSSSAAVQRVKKNLSFEISSPACSASQLPTTVVP